MKKRYLLPMMLAAMALSAAIVAQSSPLENDAVELDVPYGTVERVDPPSAAWTEPVEHPRRARVRLDDGRTLEVLLPALQHLGVGQRVRLVPGAQGLLAEKG